MLFFVSILLNNNLKFKIFNSILLVLFDKIKFCILNNLNIYSLNLFKKLNFKLLFNNIVTNNNISFLLKYYFFFFNKKNYLSKYFYLVIIVINKNYFLTIMQKDSSYTKINLKFIYKLIR